MWMFTVIGVFGCLLVNEMDSQHRFLCTRCSGYDYHMHHVLCDKAWWRLAGLWSVQGQTERKSQEGCVFNPRILPWKAKLLQRALRFLQNSLAPQPHLKGEERNCMSADKERLLLEINYCVILLKSRMKRVHETCSISQKLIKALDKYCIIFFSIVTNLM